MTSGIYKRTEKARTNIGEATRRGYKEGIRKLPSSCWEKGNIPWNKGISSKLPKNPYRVCKNCGKEYIPTSGKQHYCNYCFFIKLKCSFCGKEIKRRRTFYDFHLKNNTLSKHTFCSKECFTNFELKNRNETRICKECGKEFNCWISSTRKFCSRPCYDKWQNNREKRECAWCDNVFIAGENSTQLYCCKRCALASTGETNIEKLMREELERRHIKFKQYEKIGTFYVDFLLKGKIIIECDGIHWHTMPEVIERDKRKNKYLKDNKYKLYRFTDKEILSDVKGCFKKIKEMKNMPRGDRTGPNGVGPNTGRGAGPCPPTKKKVVKRRPRLGLGLGVGRGIGAGLGLGRRVIKRKSK